MLFLFGLTLNGFQNHKRPFIKSTYNVVGSPSSFSSVAYSYCDSCAIGGCHGDSAAGSCGWGFRGGMGVAFLSCEITQNNSLAAHLIMKVGQ